MLADGRAVGLEVTLFMPADHELAHVNRDDLPFSLASSDNQAHLHGNNLETLAASLTLRVSVAPRTLAASLTSGKCRNLKIYTLTRSVSEAALFKLTFPFYR